MSKIADRKVAVVFQQWPDDVRKKLLQLRQLILDTAGNSDDVGEVEETLKWGEPSYLCQSGSTIRLGWRASDSRHFGMYFNCNSKLIETFREVYADEFEFEGNRALIFDIDDEIPVAALSHCIHVALCYHRCKGLPLLGM